jgi:hypothetical protein
MRFWIREIFGWLLVALGLFIFYVCFSILLTDRPLLLEAGPLTLIGIIVFRGGIHLLKVAVAARICMKAPALAARHEPAAERAQPRASQPLEW